jgi:hypothetical protein
VDGDAIGNLTWGTDSAEEIGAFGINGNLGRLQELFIVDQNHAGGVSKASHLSPA